MAEKERFIWERNAFRRTVKIIVALLGQWFAFVVLVDFSVLALPLSAVWQRSRSDLSRGKPALKFNLPDQNEKAHLFGVLRLKTKSLKKWLCFFAKRRKVWYNRRKEARG